MPYTHFRFIAYEVPTATSRVDGTGGVVCDYSPGDLCPAIGRVPVPADTPDDAKKRLQRLAAVVNFAANQLQFTVLGDNANTLKIFIVPEFYFRPPATTGAAYVSGTYPVHDRAKILTALDTMFLDPAFANWLFIPGTMLWNTLDDTTRATLFFNTLVHVRGGVENSLHVIEKNQPSSIDGMPVVGIPARDPHYAQFHQDWRNRKHRVATLDGTPLGFDICLDHLDSPNCRILKNVLHDWPANEGNANQTVSLHLLCAAGMPIQPRSVAARVNGFILRNDGIAPAVVSPRSELRKITAYTATDPLGVHPFAVTPSDLTGTATLDGAIASTHTVALPDVLKVPSKGPAFRTFDQRVLFYPVQPLP